MLRLPQHRQGAGEGLLGAFVADGQAHADGAGDFAAAGAHRDGNAAPVLLKLLFDARADGRSAMPTGELARAAQTPVDEAELLLESLERLGYVRRAAKSVTGPAREQDWLLACDTKTMTLAPVFGRFAVDPANTLLSVESLGLAPVHARWSAAGWLKAPLDAALAGA